MTLILPRHYARPLGGGGGTITAEIPTGTTSGINTHDNSSVTFSSFAFGAAAAGRQIVVGIAQTEPTGTVPSITSVTIGGVTATQLFSYQSAGAQGAVAIYAAAVPSGTSGNIVVNYSDSMKTTSVFLWRVTGADISAPHDTATDYNSDPLTASIDCEAGGAIFAIFGSRDSTSGSWSGVDDLEHSAILSGSRVGAANAEVFAAAQTSLSVSYSGAGAVNDETVAWVALSPA